MEAKKAINMGLNRTVPIFFLHIQLIRVLLNRHVTFRDVAKQKSPLLFQRRIIFFVDISDIWHVDVYSPWDKKIRNIWIKGFCANYYNPHKKKKLKSGNEKIYSSKLRESQIKPISGKLSPLSFHQSVVSISRFQSKIPSLSLFSLLFRFDLGFICT